MISIIPQWAKSNCGMWDIPDAELFVCPAESHLLWFSRFNTAVEEMMRAFLQAYSAKG